jgi:hypothetical protein
VAVADGSAAAEQQRVYAQRSAAAGFDGRLGRAGQRGGIDPRRFWLAGPDRRHRVLSVTAQANSKGRNGVASGVPVTPGPHVDGARRLEAEHS